MHIKLIFYLSLSLSVQYQLITEDEDVEIIHDNTPMTRGRRARRTAQAFGNTLTLRGNRYEMNGNTKLLHMCTVCVVMRIKPGGFTSNLAI